MGAYIYTHTDKTGYVPPTLYVRVVDSAGNPVKNASCYADIETEQGIVEDKPLAHIGIFRQLECYGREKCPKEDFEGYYRLDVYIYRITHTLFSFFRMDGLIYGDFDIRIVCRTATSVAGYEFNRTNFHARQLTLQEIILLQIFTALQITKKQKNMLIP